MKTRFLQPGWPAVTLLSTIVLGTGWGVWRSTHPPQQHTACKTPDYGASMADQDFERGQKRFLVYGLNTARPPLSTELATQGVTYFEVAGCVPPMDSLHGITAYNHRMKYLLEKDSGLDLRRLLIR